MSELQSYPWYISDWRQDEAVLAMTAEQQGIYRNLIDMCWDIGDLPTNEKALIGLAMCTEREWKRSWSAVRPMFVEIDGRLHNKKVDAKRPEIVGYKEGRKRGAQTTNEKRWGNRPATNTNGKERIAKGSLSDSLSESLNSRSVIAERSVLPSPSPSPSPCSANASLPPLADRTDEPPDLTSFAATVRNQFPVSRRGSLIQVQQAIAGEFGPLPADRLVAAMDRTQRNLAAYLESDDVQRGVCFSAARWISEGHWRDDPPAPAEASADDPFACLGGRK